jgi:hypothetical protein
MYIKRKPERSIIMDVKRKPKAEHRPANMEEWIKLEPTLTAPQKENIFSIPEKPGVYHLERAMRKCKFFLAMTKKYKSWFSSHEEFNSAQHGFNDLYWKFFNELQRIQPYEKRRRKTRDE